MKNRVLLVIILIIINISSFAKEGFYHKPILSSMDKGDKIAILVVHFGTTHNLTRSLTIDKITERIRDYYADIEVREAYSSRIVIGRLAKHGVFKKNTEEALYDLAKDGYTHVIVQSTTILEGTEMRAIREEVKELESQFKDIRVANPLLFFKSDYDRLIEIIDYKGTDLKVLVGHGSYDPATAQYAMLEHIYRGMGVNNVIVSTIEGYPSLDDLIEILSQNEIRERYARVLLSPLMIVAGEHAKNDIAEDWRESIESLGYEVNLELKGLGEYPQISDMFIQSIKYSLENKRYDILEKKRGYRDRYIKYTDKNTENLGLSSKVNENSKLSNDSYFNAPVEIKDIVVIGQKDKREVLKLDVPTTYLPISINVMTEQTLNKIDASDILNTSRFLPGVKVNNSYGGFLTLTVRGFSRAPILIDGIRDERTMINSFPFPDISMAESVELIKGPASVLYGHSAVGGAINVVRKSAQSKSSFYTNLSYGSYKDKRTSAGLGGNLVGPVNYLANFNYSQREGWRDNGDSRLSGYLTLSANLKKFGKIDIRGGFNNDFYGTEIGLPPNMTDDIYSVDGDALFLSKGEMLPNLDRSARYNNPSDFFKHNSWNVSVNYHINITDRIKLANKVSFWSDDINYFGTEYLTYLTSNNPIYDRYFIKNGVKQYICLDTVARNSPLRFSHLADIVTNDISLSGSHDIMGMKSNFSAGYTYTYMQRDSYSGYNLGNDVFGPGLYSKVSVYNPQPNQGYMETRFSRATVTSDFNNSFYIHNLLEISDKFKWMLSGRYDFYRYRRAIAPITDGERKYSKNNIGDYSYVNTSSLSYRTGFVYFVDKNTTVYASIGSFFKPYRTLYSQNTVYYNSKGNRFFPQENKEVFKPESGYQTEIGFTYSFLDYLKVNTSLFYILKENSTQNLGTLEELNSEGVLVKKSIIGQVGVMDSKGFDIELNITPIKSFFAIIGYSFTDARYRDVKKNPFLEDFTNKGDRVTGVPESTFYSILSYDLSSILSSGTSIDFNASYTDKVFRNYKTNLYYPSYLLAGCGVNYNISSGVTLKLSIDNLFNKSYHDQSLGSQIVPGMPRSYRLSLRYAM